METLQPPADLLACPVCKEKNIISQKDAWFCPTCRHRYPLLRIGDETMVDFLPDADSTFQNPVRKLWNHLLENSSEGEEDALRHGLSFDNMDAMHSRFEVEGDRVLDIGGGSGYLRRYLKSSQMYVNLEPDPAALAHRIYFKHLDPRLDEPFLFLRGVAEYMPFRAASFDALYMGGMIEHVFDINLTFSEASRVLKGGGHLYLFAGCGGYIAKATRLSTAAKIKGYLKRRGFVATVRRVWQKMAYRVQQRFNPWKNIITFTQGQTESGHIYDNLFKDDIIGLAVRYGLVLSKSMDIPETGDTVFIFAKP